MDNKFDSTIKNTFVLFGYKLLFSLLAFAFISSFAWLVSTKNGAIIYSSVTALLYFSAVYCYVWKIGKFNSKAGIFKVSNAIIPIVISEIIAFAMTIFSSILNNEILTGVLRVFQFVYLGFLTTSISYYLVFIPIFIIAIIAYILGHKKFEIYENILLKVIYKK